MEWALSIVGWVIIGAAAVMVLWALFWDRPRGRRRCPKCWYDMAGVPGLVCPECGRDARREGRLFKTRRRWRWAALALLILLGAGAVHPIRQAHEHGWPAAAPTTVLLALLPHLERRPYETAIEDATFWQRLGDDLSKRRLQQGQMRHWQYTWLIERCLRGDRQCRPGTLEWRERYGRWLRVVHWQTQGATSLTDRHIQQIERGVVLMCIEHRERWPVDMPLRVRVTEHCNVSDDHELHLLAELPDAEPTITMIRGWSYYLAVTPAFGGPWMDNTVVLGTPAAEQPRVAVSAIWQVDPHRRGLTGRDAHSEHLIDLPVHIGGTVDDIMTPVDDDRLARALVAGAAFCALHQYHGLMLRLFSPGAAAVDAALISDPNLTLALRLELYRDDELVASGEAWWRGKRHPSLLQLVAAELPDVTKGRWTLRMIGDPVVALRDFESTRYWRGDVTIPVEWGRSIGW